jgi:tetratricopeptide (TPR) repeat protein
MPQGPKRRTKLDPSCASGVPPATVKRKAFLWVTTALALAVPPVALGVRWREAGEAGAHLARGLDALSAPLDRAPSPESLDWRTAEREFESARTLDADSADARRAEALLHVARAYQDLSRGEMALAQTEASTATRMLPSDPYATLALALVTLRRGDAARAESLFGAVDRSPDAPPALKARSGVHHVDVLLDAGRAHDALTLVESLDRSFATSAAVANRVGLVRAAVGDVDGSRAAFARARTLDPRDPSPIVNLARMARARGALDEAKALLEESLAIDAQNGEALLAYGVVLSELGPDHRAAAREAVTRAAQLRPDDAEPWVAQGDLDILEGRWADAVTHLREALAHDPTHAGARTNLGVALARTGDRVGAMRAFREATERAPNTGAAWNGLGAMRLASGDAEGAVGPLQQATVLLPEDPNPALNLGLALVRLERWNDAAQAFRETLRRAPTNEVALAHLASLQPDHAARQRVLNAARLARR